MTAAPHRPSGYTHPVHQIVDVSPTPLKILDRVSQRLAALKLALACSVTPYSEFLSVYLFLVGRNVLEIMRPIGLGK